MVAQVGPPPDALQRLDRQHRVPLDVGRVEPGPELLVARDASGPEVVEQQPDGDSPPGGAHECLVEGVGHVVPGRDVELDVDPRRGAVDLRSHGCDRGAVAGEEVDPVAAEHRHRSEVPVQRGHRRQVPRPGDLGSHGGQAGGPLDDQRVDLGLLLPAPALDPGPAQHQEDDEPGERDDEDQEQPRHPARGATVPRYDADRHHLDHQVEQVQSGRDPGCHARQGAVPSCEGASRRGDEVPLIHRPSPPRSTAIVWPRTAVARNTNAAT